MAADEKTGEADILFSQLSGNGEGRISPDEVCNSLFIRLDKVSLSGLPLSSRVGSSHDPKCNSTIYNVLWRTFRECN